MVMLRFVLDVARTALLFLVLAPATILGGVVVLLAGRAGNQHIPDLVAATWARLLLFLAGVRYSLAGQEHLVPGQPYVAVSNHISNLDPMLNFLAMEGYSLRYMAKKELYRVPFLGWAIDAMGMVKIDRQDASHDYINAQVAQLFEWGGTLIAYPEGTRSRTGHQREFKKGAFLIAVHHQVPVVPMTVFGPDEAWKPGDWRVRGGTAQVVVGEPIATEGLTEDDVEDLRDRVAAIVHGTYDELAAQS